MLSEELADILVYSGRGSCCVSVLLIEQVAETVVEAPVVSVKS